jgi:hypothetical protein
MKHTLNEPEHLRIVDSDANYWLDKLYEQEGESAAYNTAKRLFWAIQGLYSHDFLTNSVYDKHRKEIINRVKRKLAEKN